MSFVSLRKTLHTAVEIYSALSILYVNNQFIHIDSRKLLKNIFWLNNVPRIESVINIHWYFNSTQLWIRISHINRVICFLNNNQQQNGNVKHFLCMLIFFFSSTYPLNQLHFDYLTLWFHSTIVLILLNFREN